MDYLTYILFKCLENNLDLFLKKMEKNKARLIYNEYLDYLVI